MPNLDGARPAGMRHASLWTPRNHALSAGLVGFDIAGLTAAQAQERLLGKGIVAGLAPMRGQSLGCQPGS